MLEHLKSLGFQQCQSSFCQQSVLKASSGKAHALYSCLAGKPHNDVSSEPCDAVVKPRSDLFLRSPSDNILRHGANQGRWVDVHATGIKIRDWILARFVCVRDPLEPHCCLTFKGYLSSEACRGSGSIEQATA